MLKFVMRKKEDREQLQLGPKIRRKERESKESRAVPAPDANAELAASLQKRQVQPHSKSRSEKFDPHPEEVASGFPIDPPRPSQAADSQLDPQQIPKPGNLTLGHYLRGLDGGKMGRGQKMLRKVVHKADWEVLWVIQGNDPNSSFQQEQKAANARMHPLFIPRRDGRPATKDPVLIGYGSKGSKIHYSGH
ncbi:hypothetical protein MLD38_000636 [Melastoma candidum]|uniref:Uncharacterized protein n=1 Tax=Melastoma candidum TaxID=119954 RepID=A0ACB9SFN0_9MYRT|nr:hypothetical protein MLD38_000636 [Melastoma candidum]